jgi:hypothetical protein
MPSSTQTARTKASVVTQPTFVSDSVNALSAELAHEFGAPIALVDPSGPFWRVRMGLASESFPNAEECMAAARARNLLETGRVTLWKPNATESSAPTWLLLPAPLPGDRVWLALVGFASARCAERSQWGPLCPDRALKAWGQAVADRLQAQSGKAGSLYTKQTSEQRPPLFDRLTLRRKVF